jgi:xanthine dehydrogenase YagR molybdenum-binding subunit
VLEILTHENTGDLKAVAFGSASTSTQQLGPEIDHDGQIVAVVLADTFEAAREAARRVRVTYAAATPSATFGAQGLTEDDATKVSERIKEAPAAGDVEAALAAADVAIDAEYATPTQHHNPIELFTTTCAWHDNRLTIYEPSQFVYGLKNSMAKKLGIDPGQVRVVSPFVGGAFGAKGQLTPRTGLIALAAKRLNRPVKLVASRDQGFTIATYRAETRHHIRLGAKADGKLVGYSHEGWEISSRRDPYCVAGVEDSARLYAFGAVGTKVNIVHADRNTPGFMRSPPVVPYIYALETAMDELAAKLRMRDGDWLIGWGCATAVYPTHVATATARVRLMPDGKVRVQSAAHELGTGAYTVIGQMAAQELGVPLAATTVELGDSDLPPAMRLQHDGQHLFGGDEGLRRDPREAGTRRDHGE